MSQLTTKQKKDWAQLLFINERSMTQKAIAEKVGVSERTLSKWVNVEKWDNLRKSLLVTKEEQLRRLYDQIDAITTDISEREKKFASSKEADTIAKLTASIKNIETETSLAEVFEIGKKFITWLQTNDFEKSKQVVDLYDGFIKDQLKRY